MYSYGVRLCWAVFILTMKCSNIENLPVLPILCMLNSPIFSSLPCAPRSWTLLETKWSSLVSQIAKSDSTQRGLDVCSIFSTNTSAKWWQKMPKTERLFVFCCSLIIVLMYDNDYFIHRTMTELYREYSCSMWDNAHLFPNNTNTVHEDMKLLTCFFCQDIFQSTLHWFLCLYPCTLIHSGRPIVWVLGLCFFLS